MNKSIHTKTFFKSQILFFIFSSPFTGSLISSNPNHMVPCSQVPSQNSSHFLFQWQETIKKPLGSSHNLAGAFACIFKVDLNMGSIVLLTWEIRTFPSGQVGHPKLPISKIPFLKVSFSTLSLTAFDFMLENVQNDQPF